MQKKAGFTLIELSIVLVIIGLIVGGILLGSTLIRSAEIRNTIKQAEAFTAAANTFLLKYNCLPGDCAEAFTLDLASAANGSGTYGEAGNGNGSIGEAGGTSEAPAFWYHLSQANLISWTPPSGGINDTISCDTDAPGICLAYKATAISGEKAGWWVHSTYTGVFITNNDQPYAAGHYLWIAGSVGAGAAQGAATLTPTEAFEIDSKIDDGFPLTGIAMIAGDVPNAAYGPTNGTVGMIFADQTCAIGAAGSYEYNTLNQVTIADDMCSLLIKAAF